LKPDFSDAKLQPEDRSYFCPSCAMVNGFLIYYPKVREQIEVIYVDFQRPRPALIDLLGSEKQSCPVLVLDGPSDARGVQSANGQWFLNDPEALMNYIAKTYQCGYPHP